MKGSQTNSNYTHMCLFLSMIFLSTGCNQNKKKEEVNQVVNQFFTAYRQYDYREMDQDLFSDQLADLLFRTAEKEDLEINRVKKSDYLTDKPFILEEVFTSTVEGADSISILYTEVEGDTAWVAVLFSDSRYGFYSEWNDRLVLVNEEGWRLHNIVYGDGTSLPYIDLHEVLEEYINTDFETDTVNQELVLQLKDEE